MPIPARPSTALVLLALGTVAPGCAQDHSQITPTTTGTDLRNMPRGRMTPLPFPGSSLAQTPKTDPTMVTAMTSDKNQVR